MRLGNYAQCNAQLQPNADANADFADQIHVVFHARLQLFLIGAALHFPEIVFEADLLAALDHEFHAKGGQHADLANQIHLGRQGDDAVEIHDDDDQRNLKQIHIAQFRLYDGLHGSHDAVHGLHVIALEAVGLDQLLQRFQRLAEIRLAVPAGHGHLQLDPCGGNQLQGGIDPYGSGLYADVHIELFGEGEQRRNGHDRLGAAHQFDGQADGDARRDGIAGNLDDGLHGEAAGLGVHARQRVGSRAIARVQLVLRILRGHHGDQHLGAQFIIAANLRGHGAFDLIDVLLVQHILQVDGARRIHVHVRQIIHGVGVQEGHDEAFVRHFGRNDLNEHDEAVIGALRPALDILLVRVDAAVVEADDLIRFKAAAAGVEQRAGDVFFLPAFILALDHRFVGNQIVPEQILDIIAEDDGFNLLAVNADQQGIHGFIKILKPQTLAQGDREAGARLKAALSIPLVGVAEQPEAVLGGLHPQGRLVDAAAAGLDGNQAVHVLHGIHAHALGRDDFNGRQPIRIVQLGRVGGSSFLFNLIGIKHGVQRHILRDRLRIAKALLAGLVDAPAAEGIAIHGGIDFIHRLAQQILAPREHQRRKLGAAHGIERYGHGVFGIDEARIERHLPVDQHQRRAGDGVFRVRIPRREHLALAGGFDGREIDDAVGQHRHRFDRRALRHKADDIAGQHQHVVRAGRDRTALAVGVAELNRARRFILNRTGGANGQALNFALHMHDAEGAAALQRHMAAPADDHFADFRIGIAAKRHILIRVDDDGFKFRTGQFKFSRMGNRQAVCVHGADFRMRAVRKDQPLRRERANLPHVLGDVKIASRLARRGQRFLAVNHRAENPRQNLLQPFCGHGILRRNLILQIVPFFQRSQRIFRTLAQQAADVLRRLLPRLCALNNGRHRIVRFRECRKRNSRREKRKAQQQRNDVPAGSDQFTFHFLSSCSAGRFMGEKRYGSFFIASFA